MTSFERKPTIELDAEDYKPVVASQNSMKTIPSIEEPPQEYIRPIQSSIYRARLNTEEGAKFPRRNSANVANIALPVAPVVVQSPKLRNRFTLNLPMSRKKKQNRRSLPTIEDNPESESGQTAPSGGSSSPAEEKRKVSSDVYTPTNPSALSPSGSDSVFNSPTSEHDAVASKVARAQSDTSSNATNANIPRVTRHSDTVLHKEDRKKALMHATNSNPSPKSPTKFLDDINPIHAYWSPSSIRRGSSPAITTKHYTGFTRQRSGVIKVKVCVAVCSGVTRTCFSPSLFVKSLRKH